MSFTPLNTLSSFSMPNIKAAQQDIQNKTLNNLIELLKSRESSIAEHEQKKKEMRAQMEKNAQKQKNFYFLILETFSNLNAALNLIIESSRSAVSSVSEYSIKKQEYLYFSNKAQSAITNMIDSYSSENGESLKTFQESKQLLTELAIIFKKFHHIQLFKENARKKLKKVYESVNIREKNLIQNMIQNNEITKKKNELATICESPHIISRKKRSNTIDKLQQNSIANSIEMEQICSEYQILSQQARESQFELNVLRTEKKALEELLNAANYHSIDSNFNKILYSEEDEVQLSNQKNNLEYVLKFQDVDKNISFNSVSKIEMSHQANPSHHAILRIHYYFVSIFYSLSKELQDDAKKVFFSAKDKLCEDITKNIDQVIHEKKDNIAGSVTKKIIGVADEMLNKILENLLTKFNQVLEHHSENFFTEIESKEEVLKILNTNLVHELVKIALDENKFMLKELTAIMMSTTFIRKDDEIKQKIRELNLEFNHQMKIEEVETKQILDNLFKQDLLTELQNIIQQIVSFFESCFKLRGMHFFKFSVAKTKFILILFLLKTFKTNGR